MKSAYRGHPGYWAYRAHRLSGLGLALFLPIHFLVLGLALEGSAALDGVLHWAERPSVKLAEAVLMVLLVVHLGGGLRLLALEFLPWSGRRIGVVGIVFGAALLAGLVFLLTA